MIIPQLKSLGRTHSHEGLSNPSALKSNCRANHDLSESMDGSDCYKLPKRRNVSDKKEETNISLGIVIVITYTTNIG